MEVEKTNFVTHLIITVQLYYRLSKNSCHDLANDICSQTSKPVFSHLVFKSLPLRMIIRTLRSNDADSNENVKEQ